MIDRFPLSGKWYGQYSMHTDCIELMLRAGDQGQNILVSSEFTENHLDHGAIYDKGPTLSLTDNSAQQIMTELWNIGIRPRDGAGTLAHVEGMRSHLDDLRKIAFHALKLPEK